MFAERSKASRLALWAAGGLLLAAGGAASSSEGAAPFVPPYAAPAERSAIAQRSVFNALARAGSRIVAAGQRGLVMYSDDSGKAWTQAQVPASADLTGLSFPTPLQGWAVGHEGVVLHTGDGGATWYRQLDGAQLATQLAQQGLAEDPAMQGADKPLLDVWFEDERNGFAVGAFNLMLRTQDGGRSWQPWMDHVENPKGLHLYAVRPACGTLYIVGEQGLVLRLDRAQQRFAQVALPYQGSLFGVAGRADMAVVFGLRGNAWRSKGCDSGEWAQVNTGVQSTLTGGLMRADGSLVLASQAGQLLVGRAGAEAPLQRVRQQAPMPIFAMSEAGDAGGASATDVALAGPGGMKVQEVKNKP